MVLKQIVTIIAFAVMSCAVAWAQVEKAVVETSGMRSCAVCNMALEVALARIPGAARVAIDGPTQTFTVFYKPDQHFNPKDLRDAAARARLEVTTIRVTTCGTVQDRDGYKYLASG